MRAGRAVTLSPKSAPSSKQSNPETSALVRIALVWSTPADQKTAHADPSRCARGEVKCHRCAQYCASSVLRAEPPGPVCDRQQQQAQLQRPQRSRAQTQPARRGANHQQRREDRGEPARTPRKKMAGIAEGRLREERRSWRKDHPIGFVARPRSKADGSTDLLNWDVRPRRFNSHQHAVAATPPRAGRDPGQKGHDVGGLRVQPHDGVLQRLPGHRAGRQVREPSGRGRELCGNQRHRADAATEKISRRWRGAPEI